MWDVTLKSVTALLSSIFLLTHPVWDVTLMPSQRRELKLFLLTHPVWDVTVISEVLELLISHFYSHIPCGM